jgi:BASS family bile acid:Na+ symporter
VTELLLVALKVSVAILILAIGLGSTFADLLYVWRRPALLLRSLLAMYVLVPLAAVVLVSLLPLGTAIKAALLVLAVSAGAPLLPRKLGAFGSEAYVFSLVVLSSLLAIVLVPAWLALAGRYFDVAAALDPRVVATIIAKSFLVPLLVGLVLRRLFPAIGEAVADRLMAIAGLALAGSALVLLATHWQLFLAFEGIGMLSLVLLLLAALVFGHAMGGPGADDRTALAIACATRHVGLAVLVASSFPGPKTTVLIAAYIVASAAVSLPYLKWRRAVSARAASP